MSFPNSQERLALVVAHPGHELRLHHLLERFRPTVFILTDGSGGGGTSRLASSARLLRRIGARPGAVFGPYRDRALYDALLAGNHSLFFGLVEALASAFQREGITAVAGDAAEGYNPSHDVCRMLIDASTLVAARPSGWLLANYAFPLLGRPDAPPPDCEGEPLLLTLDDAALARKQAAASDYPELQAEIETALQAWGWEAFRFEALFPLAGKCKSVCPRPAPYYEQFGAEQVRAGRYRQCIRYLEHVAPLSQAMREFVQRRSRCLASEC